MKRICVLILCIVLLLSAAPAFTENATLPEYLNIESSYPIIKDGYDVPLRFGYVTDSSYAKAEGSMYFNLVEKVLGIKPELLPIENSAYEERLNLMFASGDIPDVLLGFSLGTDGIVKYGMGEHQLLALDNYLTPELMPNIVAEAEAHPEFLKIARAPDGFLYAIPRILGEYGINDNSNIRTSWLKALGLESPKTLDEFLDDMRAFKEKDVDGHGSENVYPLGGSYESLNPFAYILNAMGYTTGYSWAGAETATGLSVSVRDGEATFACNDDLFYEFMKIAKTCYDEGLIAPNFFTMDSAQVNGMAAEGVFGFVCQPMHVLFSDPKDFQQWYNVSPLTSQWNEKAQATAASCYDLVSIFFGADTQYPEVCARFVDFYYSEYGYMMWYGPAAGSPEAEICGTPGFIWGGDSPMYEGEASSYLHIISTLQPGNFQFGRFDPVVFERASKSLGIDYTFELEPLEDMDVSIGANWSGHGQRAMVAPYAEAESTYPTIVFRTETDVSMIADYKAVIDPYVKEQFAMFVTGKRDLNEEEFAKYLAELKTMGMDEYEQFYQNEYANYKSQMT